MNGRDPHQAHHVLRAFRYQLLQSVQAWLDLRATSSPLMWVNGANGVGKTTLAGLIAQSRGGSWLLCDFRPYSSQSDAREVIAVWHELVLALATKPRFDGVILDDLSARGVDLLKHRIAGLVEAFAPRGAEIIITSNHTPSPALLLDLGATQNALVDAPYFSLEEVQELVAQHPAPPENQAGGWAHLIWVTASGGHPTLTVAKILNLRARGWPQDALVEDFGPQPSVAVQVTRQEARKRLLAELPSEDTRRLLERASTVYASFEDGLVAELCKVEPKIPYAGDSLAVLKGSWIEPAPDGGWRISPLLADLGNEAPEDQARVWRCIAAQYWLQKKTLDARTLPLCFWNAYFGRHLFVLAKLGEMIQTLPPARLRAAAAMLSPLTAFRTDVSLFPEEPMTAMSLRLMQVCIADAVEDERVATEAAESLLREIDALTNVEFGHGMVCIGAWRVGAAPRAHAKHRCRKPIGQCALYRGREAPGHFQSPDHSAGGGFYSPDGEGIGRIEGLVLRAGTGRGVRLFERRYVARANVDGGASRNPRRHFARVCA